MSCILVASQKISIFYSSLSNSAQYILGKDLISTYCSVFVLVSTLR